MVRTRLDTVVTVKERVEERAGQALARAESVVSSAQARAEEARRVAAQDNRMRADVSQWEVTELAHHRALVDARRAQRELESAQRTASSARDQYLSAHRAAEVVRRVADNRREETARELNRLEDKALDEAAGLLFVRKAG
ncbi:MAG: hypothetical protein ACOZQL_29350 [Myxococcota bacterium]